MTIPGSLDGIEAGLRQVRRRRPLETCKVDVGPGLVVTAPTEDEALRVKAHLVVQRNAVRAYMDVAALAEHVGFQHAVGVLARIDDFFADRSNDVGSVLTDLVLAHANPAPRDVEVTMELLHYKGLSARWHDWSEVVRVCQGLASRLMTQS